MVGHRRVELGEIHTAPERCELRLEREHPRLDLGDVRVGLGRVRLERRDLFAPGRVGLGRVRLERRDLFALGRDLFALGRGVAFQGLKARIDIGEVGRGIAFGLTAVQQG